MSTHLRLIAAAVTALAMSQASAQSYGNPDYSRGYGNGYGYGNSQAIRCESVHSRRTYCRVGIQGTVRLTRQLSHNACIQGRTWAADSRGIWVSNGCRGDFAVSSRRRGHGNDGYDPNRTTSYYDNGSTYGSQNDYRDRGYYNNGDAYQNGNNYSNGSSQIVRCDSTGYGRTYCSSASSGTVRLSRTYGGECIQGQTWGADQRGIWVSGDCEASFNIEENSNYDSDYYQR